MTLPDTPPRRLPGRTVISVAGDEARSFLQRVITADVTGLEPGECRPGALLTPQGKILADFMIFAEDNTVWLDVPEAPAEGLVKRLTLFKLRAKAEIVLNTDLAAVWATAPFPGSAPDPRLGGRIHRGIARALEAGEDKPLDAYEFEAGVPAFGRDYGEAEVFPTDVNLDVYGGVGWKKGCFIGQEVVSRMKRRGTIRKRSIPAVFAGEAPPRGTAVMAGTAKIGAISSSAGHTAIVLARIDKLAEVDRHAEADGQQVHLTIDEALLPPPPAQQPAGRA
jgi:folate-binding protein YgfZ